LAQLALRFGPIALTNIKKAKETMEAYFPPKSV